MTAALAAPRSKPTRRWLALASLAVLIGAAGVCAWQATHNNRVLLTRLDVPVLSSAPCPGQGVTHPGPTAVFVMEWQIAANPLEVLNRLMQQGWEPVTRIGNNVKLVPVHPTTAQLGPVQVRVISEASLWYSGGQYATRLVLPLSVVFCLS